MRIVIDTNIVASALFFGGKPRELLELLFLKQVDVYASREIVEEYGETVEYLFEKYPNRISSVPLSSIVSRMHMIETHSIVEVCRDPDDNKFIECALDASCLYIVSGDKDLLELKEYKDIQVMTVADFLKGI